jgi:hypothetical protein
MIKEAEGQIPEMSVVIQFENLTSVHFLISPRIGYAGEFCFFPMGVKVVSYLQGRSRIASFWKED